MHVKYPHHDGEPVAAHSLPFLIERLRTPKPADANYLADLLNDLESKSLETRQNAEGEFLALGEAAEPALRQTLARNPRLDVGRRIERILEQREPEVLRVLRSIDALAEIATPESRAFLAELAKSSPNPRVLQAANVAAIPRVTWPGSR